MHIAAIIIIIITIIIMAGIITILSMTTIIQDRTVQSEYERRLTTNKFNLYYRLCYYVTENPETVRHAN